jgi:hypothetical protein
MGGLYIIVIFVCLRTVMSKILSYQVSLRSAFHVVMSATISGLKRRSVRPDLHINRANGALLQTTGVKTVNIGYKGRIKTKHNMCWAPLFIKQTQIT